MIAYRARIKLHWSSKNDLGRNLGMMQGVPRTSVFIQESPEPLIEKMQKCSYMVITHLTLIEAWIIGILRTVLTVISDFEDGILPHHHWLIPAIIARNHWDSWSFEGVPWKSDYVTEAKSLKAYENPGFATQWEESMSLRSGGMCVWWGVRPQNKPAPGHGHFRLRVKQSLWFHQHWTKIHVPRRNTK